MAKLTVEAAYLMIQKGDKRDFSKLERVTGGLELLKGAELNAPALTQTDKLWLGKDAELVAPALTRTGELTLFEGAKINAPALTQTGWLTLNPGAKLDAPALTQTGWLTLNPGAKLTAPALTEVERLYVYPTAALNAPNIRIMHGKLGRLLALSGYGLWLSDTGEYFAGCRGPFTREQALEHWSRDDERAIKFTQAILKEG